MNEGSLLDNHDENYEAYRFLWLRAFHHPVEVLAERHGYKFYLSSKELNGAGGYAPGKMWRTDNKWLTEEDWCILMAAMDKADFWEQETKVRDNIGTDGSEWVLEGRKNGRYHIVDRWFPETGNYREACLELLKLSGRDPKSIKDLY